MSDTVKPMGRPLKYDEKLERIQLLIRPSQRRAAEREAARRATSVSEIYRQWMDKGQRK